MGRRRYMSGFGSRPEREPEALTGVVLAAVRRAGKRAVLLTGWGGLKVTDSSDHVLVVDYVPHDWLFPQMAAVEHHGGAGTTGTTIQSGTPSTVVPSFADQFFWGERVESLGVGVNLPRRRLTIESLSGAIPTTNEETVHTRAAELGGRLRAENGVNRAIDVASFSVGGGSIPVSGSCTPDTPLLRPSASQPGPRASGYRSPG